VTWSSVSKVVSCNFCPLAVRLDGSLSLSQNQSEINPFAERQDNAWDGWGTRRQEWMRRALQTFRVPT
jgi:regulator of RNase E activity RraB